MIKLISLFLMFSILNIGCATISSNHVTKAKPKKRGTDLIIQKTNETHIRGELISVKQNSLLLLDRESGADMTMNIDDIRVITVAGKSKALLGAGLGFLAGASAGAIVGHQLSKAWWWDQGTEICAAIGGLAGALVGGLIIGASAGKEETIQIEGKSGSEIQDIMEKLRKKARVKNAQ